MYQPRRIKRNFEKFQIGRNVWKRVGVFHITQQVPPVRNNKNTMSTEITTKVAHRNTSHIGTCRVAQVRRRRLTFFLRAVAASRRLRQRRSVQSVP